MNAFLDPRHRVLPVIDARARDTPNLHRLSLEYGTYGVVLLVALVPAAPVITEQGSTRDLAATSWTRVVMLLPAAVNQPLGQLFGEPRPYAGHTGIRRLVEVLSPAGRAPSSDTRVRMAP